MRVMLAEAVALHHIGPPLRASQRLLHDVPVLPSEWPPEVVLSVLMSVSALFGIKEVCQCVAHALIDAAARALFVIISYKCCQAGVATDRRLARAGDKKLLGEKLGGRVELLCQGDY